MIRWGLLAAVLVFVADQASKWWVLNVLHLPELGSVPLLPVLSLTMVWNQGVTFGLSIRIARPVPGCWRG